jgi:ATP-dependent DNA helicase PIF1
MTVLHLSQNMRLISSPESQHFAQWLLDVGHGRTSLPMSSSGMHSGAASVVSGSVALPESFLCQTQNDLVDAIYGRLSENMTIPPEYFQERMILAPRNADVSELNNIILDRHPGNAMVFISADTHVTGHSTETELNLPTEYLNSINASGLPPSRLALKIGSPIILLRNIAAKRGLCNGTRAIILQMSSRVLQVRLMSNDHNGEIAFIPRISLSPSDSNLGLAFKLRRRQFPVQLAYTMSINKAQGQSVKYVGIDLRTPVFSHGQLYVALSRVTSPSNVKVLLQDSFTNSTTNIVYPEVLLD